MEIKGIENMSVEEFNMQLQQGAKFVIYQYCISIIVLSFRRSSNIFFIKHGESAVMKGLPYTLLALFLGWWGIPWGPIWTIQSFYYNLKGGKDVTAEVLAAMNPPAAPTTPA